MNRIIQMALGVILFVAAGCAEQKQKAVVDTTDTQESIVPVAQTILTAEVSVPPVVMPDIFDWKGATVDARLWPGVDMTSACATAASNTPHRNGIFTVWTVGTDSGRAVTIKELMIHAAQQGLFLADPCQVDDLMKRSSWRPGQRIIAASRSFAYFGENMPVPYLYDGIWRRQDRNYEPMNIVVLPLTMAVFMTPDTTSR
ncbi:hypothetical protein HY480_01785 [Candidatus Uhrbacteria bacterium]|nr:hypothetical protein [Candidatus Uhrbacteria bacterium]